MPTFDGIEIAEVACMKTTIPIISDSTLSGENYGCLINGELHIAPTLYRRMCNTIEIDYSMLMNLTVIDVDELVYTEKLDEMIIFAGQQVKVYTDGFYLGDGTITCYPYAMHFEQAEVRMHFPFKDEVKVCKVSELTPICSAKTE
jgi:hypothetical protein